MHFPSSTASGEDKLIGLGARREVKLLHVLRAGANGSNTKQMKKKETKSKRMVVQFGVFSRMLVECFLNTYGRRKERRHLSATRFGRHVAPCKVVMTGPQ